jgi:hypothetical protein
VLTGLILARALHLELVHTVCTAHTRHHRVSLLVPLTTCTREGTQVIGGGGRQVTQEVLVHPSLLVWKQRFG